MPAAVAAGDRNIAAIIGKLTKDKRRSSVVQVLLTEAVKRRPSPYIQPGIADGRGAETNIFQVILGQNLPIAVRPQHRQLAGLA
jgi:hypothetical protein